MFGRNSKISSDANAILAAIGRSQAIIEFDMDGLILTANQNFCDAMGYALPEIVGRHHRMFITEADAGSADYRIFWEELGAGKFKAAQFKRIGKGGHEVWIEASYNPVLDVNGKPYKVVKFATDVSRQKQDYADLSGQVKAINKSQAVIEFDLDGTIRTANDNFLSLMGYTLAEIRGKPHRVCVSPEERDSPAYAKFWEQLRSGEFKMGRFKRVGKGDREIWIEASYNPILDTNGRPFKVVKYATDVTAQGRMLAAMTAIIDKMDSATARSTALAGDANRSSGQASTNMQTMSASTEQLAASIQEIATMMARSNRAAVEAHGQATSAEGATLRLSETSQSMGGIVELIRNIASQINLLALNATIEAARAGESGKGFAVVAGEVKKLANDARQATDRIASEIDRLQGVSDEVVASLGVIGRSISDINECVSGASGAVEEQSAVTQEMSSRMRDTAAGVVTINDNIAEMMQVANDVSTAVEETRKVARALDR